MNQIGIALKLSDELIEKIAPLIELSKLHIERHVNTRRRVDHRYIHTVRLVLIQCFF
jgi:hypothetical protein